MSWDDLHRLQLHRIQGISIAGLPLANLFAVMFILMLNIWMCYFEYMLNL